MGVVTLECFYEYETLLRLSDSAYCMRSVTS